MNCSAHFYVINVFRLFLILIIFFTLPFLCIFLPVSLPLYHILVKVLSIWKLKIILLYEKKLKVEKLVHQPTQNSQIFICHVVLAFPMESIICLKSLRKKIFMAVEGEGRELPQVISWHLTVCVDRALLDRSAGCLSRVQKAPWDSCCCSVVPV